MRGKKIQPPGVKNEAEPQKLNPIKQTKEDETDPFTVTLRSTLRESVRPLTNGARSRGCLTR